MKHYYIIGLYSKFVLSWHIYTAELSSYNCHSISFKHIIQLFKKKKKAEIVGCASQHLLITFWKRISLSKRETISKRFQFISN